MTKSIFPASRFILLWLLCPLVALATFRVLFASPEVTMEGFLYHIELRPIAFYGHIFLASVALAVLPFQLWTQFRVKHLQLHRWIGRIYGLSIVVSGISGFWLAITTQSGAIAAWGFALLAVAWIYTTGYGILLAMNRDIVAHQRWMIRSAALTMAAVTLRIYLGTGILLGSSYGDIVGFLAWSCWVPNLIVAEFILLRGRRQKITRTEQHSQLGESVVMPSP